MSKHTALTKQEIIVNLFNDKECRDYIRKVCKHKDLADDLMQYSLETLLNKDDEFIIKNHNEDSLKRYFAGIIYKSYNSTTSPFYNEFLKFRSNSYPVNDYVTDEKLVNIFEVLELKEINKIIADYEAKGDNEWFDASVLRLYMRFRNMRVVSRETKIPLATIYNAISNIRTYLNDYVCLKYY